MIIGIDPGLSGGLAVVDGALLLAVSPMPTKPMPTNNKKQMVDPDGIARVLKDWFILFNAQQGCIEQVSARPNQGVTSMFNFGMSYGIILGAFASADMNLSSVTSHRWKKDLGLTSNKDQSREMALQLWPDFDDSFKRKKDDGIAEAALIGLWYDSHVE